MDFKWVPIIKAYPEMRGNYLVSVQLVDICDIALSVAAIRDRDTEITVSMNQILDTVRKVKNSCGRCNDEMQLLINQIEYLAKKCGYHTEKY